METCRVYRKATRRDHWLSKGLPNILTWLAHGRNLHLLQEEERDRFHRLHRERTFPVTGDRD